MRPRHRSAAPAALLIATLAFPWSCAAAPAPRALGRDALGDLAALVQHEIASGRVPGAVVLIGQGPDVIYRGAFGARATDPAVVPMTTDTVFDLASLTKVVATTTAVMQLVERGRLALDAPAWTYWPAFGTAGKRAITVRDLLTHYSGLRADLDLSRPWVGYRTAMTLLARERPASAPSTAYVYSDENFEALGELVQRVSGTSLDRYCDTHIFRPLGMADTGFRLSQAEARRIAPTSIGRAGVLVNDPTARRMGGVAGHAGLFSTADDLARFASMLLHKGGARGRRVLSAGSIELMTHPASPAGGAHARGLGWDLGEPFVRAPVPNGVAPSFGHTGFTGTMLWLDPASQTYVVILSNRTYPDGHGDAQPLRQAILGRVSQSLSRAPGF